MTLLIELWSSEMYALAKLATIVLVIVGVVRFISSIKDGIKEDKQKKINDEKKRKEEEFLNTMTDAERSDYLLRQEKIEFDAQMDAWEQMHNK